MAAHATKLVGIALVFALAATTVGAEEPARPDQIAYREIGPHGVGSREWLLHEGGQGTYRSDRDGPAPVEASFDLGPAGYNEVLAIIGPLEQRRDMACTASITDQAIGVLTWLHGIRHVSVHVDFGCTPAAGEDALDRIEQVTGLIRDSVSGG